jgi:hypothetical protein
MNTNLDSGIVVEEGIETAQEDNNLLIDLSVSELDMAGGGSAINAFG